MHELRIRVRNSLLGVHLGDRAGIETEMMSRQEILEVTGGLGIRHPSDRIDPALRKVKDTRDLPPGSTSDDSALTDANATGFIMAGRYDRELFALLHLRAFKEGLSGWGGTTKIAMWEIDKFYGRQAHGAADDPHLAGLSKKDIERWRKAHPRDPRVPARIIEEGSGRGNGVAMKIAPFALHDVVRHNDDEHDQLLDEVMQHGQMTHGDIRASIGGYAVAAAVAMVLRAPLRRAAPDTLAFRARLLGHLKTAEARYRYGASSSNDRLFTDALVTAFARLDTDPDGFTAAWGRKKTSDTLVTVPLALCIFLRHPDDPCGAILEAVNAGGDTDTVASMVGAMCGANSASPDVFPPDWLETLSDRGQGALALADELYAVSSRERPPRGYDLNALKRELGYL